MSLSLRRFLPLLSAPLFGFVACDGGPTESFGPRVSGIYSGTRAITYNECTPELGELAGVASISVTQSQGGTSIDLALPGTQSGGPGDVGIPAHTASGTFLLGTFNAANAGVIGAIGFGIEVGGSIAGDHMVGGENVTMSTSTETCRVSISFDMRRESR